MKRIMTLLVVATMALVTVSTAQASAIYDSISGADYMGFGVTSTARSAQSFLTGAESSTLGSVVLRMTASLDNGAFSVHLYDATGAGDKPGAKLLDLAGSANPVVGSNTYTGTTMLSANTKYWVVANLSNPSSNSYYLWQCNESGLETAGSGAAAASANSGLNWSDYPGYDLKMQVNTGTSAVPEPGTILAALSILGPAGMIFRRR